MMWRTVPVAALAVLACAPTSSAFFVVRTPLLPAGWRAHTHTACSSSAPPPARGLAAPGAPRPVLPTGGQGLLYWRCLTARACRASPTRTRHAGAQGSALPQLRSASLRSATPMRMSATEPVAAGAKLTFTQEMRAKAMSLHTFSQVRSPRLP